MPWPGTPKSQQSPPINPPSQRYPFTLNEHSSMRDVADAMRTAFDGLTVHEQAFANLPGQISAQAMAAATTVVQNIASENVTNVVTAFNAKIGPVVYFPSLGAVHNLQGQSSYATQQSDNGSVLLFADSTPVAVTLSSLAIPWFCLISNLGAGEVDVTPDSGMVNGVPFIALPDSSWGIVFADGNNFWMLGVSS